MKNTFTYRCTECGNEVLQDENFTYHSGSKCPKCSSGKLEIDKTGWKSFPPAQFPNPRLKKGRAKKK